MLGNKYQNEELITSIQFVKRDKNTDNTICIVESKQNSQHLLMFICKGCLEIKINFTTKHQLYVALE